MKNFIITGFLFFATALYAVAQVPVEDETEVDTVVINESPVVYSRPLIIQDVKTVKFYLSTFGIVFANTNYYHPCESCKEFLAAYKSSVKSKINYGGGIELTYVPRKILLSVAIDFSVIREKFDYTNASGIEYKSDNSYTYADVRFLTGYWIRRDKKNFSLIFNGGIAYSNLLNAKGYINDFTDSSRVISIASSGKLRTSQANMTVGTKIIFIPHKRLKLSIEPYYMGNIFNITKVYYPYVQFWNRFGIRTGFIFSL